MYSVCMNRPALHYWGGLFLGFLGMVGLNLDTAHAQTTYTLTDQAEIGNALSALPASISVGGSEPNFLYTLGADTLNMDDHDIIGGTLTNATFTLGSLRYDTNSMHGGVFDLGGDGKQGSLQIDASGSVLIRAIKTASSQTTSKQGLAGNVTVNAVADITILGGVNARAVGSNNPSGTITIESSSGAVRIDGEVRSTSNKYPKPIMVTGQSLLLADVSAHANGSSQTCAGQSISLTATAGGVIVRGDLDTWGGNNPGGNITISSQAGGAIKVMGEINTRTHHAELYTGGSIAITSAGAIEIGGAMDSSAGVPINCGDLSLQAPNGGITLHSLRAERHNAIALIANSSTGIVVRGALTGLEEDCLDGIIDRFASVTADIQYDPNKRDNLYLAGRTYPLAGAGGYRLTPSRPFAPKVPTLNQIQEAGVQRVQWSGATGRVYSVYHSESLTSDDWTFVGLTTNGTSAELGLGSEQAGFYRVSAEPEPLLSPLSAALTFAEAVLAHGRDRYGAVHTPLFVDGLHVESLKPAAWIFTTGDKWIMSDYANQQPLMRLLDGLTALTGTNSYRAAAEAATAYMLTNAISGSGMLYWGGHTVIDLEEDSPAGTQWGKAPSGPRNEPQEMHELKGTQPYFEMMWRVDPTQARKVAFSIWGGHITDWTTLDYNRHGTTSKDLLRSSWGTTFDESGTVPFVTTGGNLAFAQVTMPFLRSSVMLALLENDDDALLWARRMANQWQRARHPVTGLSGGQLSWRIGHDRAIDALAHAYPSINEANIVASYHQTGRYHDLPLAQMQAGEALLAAGGPRAVVGQEFIDWAASDLVTYAERCYDDESGLFLSMMTDGTLIDANLVDPGYYIPEDMLPLEPDGNLLWSYALAYRLKGQRAHWDMLRKLWPVFGLGTLGEPDGSGRALATGFCESREWRAIYALLELKRATGDDQFLTLAGRIANNLIELQSPSGFFPRPAPLDRRPDSGVYHARHMDYPPNPDRSYARTGDEVPLALLHLAAALEGKSALLPQPVFDDQYFHCPFMGALNLYQQKRNDSRTYDWLVFYGPDYSW